jgi:hypothetical protein
VAAGEQDLDVPLRGGGLAAEARVQVVGDKRYPHPPATPGIGGVPDGVVWTSHLRSGVFTVFQQERLHHEPVGGGFPAAGEPRFC